MDPISLEDFVERVAARVHTQFPECTPVAIDPGTRYGWVQRKYAANIAYEPPNSVSLIRSIVADNDAQIEAMSFAVSETAVALIADKIVNWLQGRL